MSQVYPDVAASETSLCLNLVSSQRYDPAHASGRFRDPATLRLTMNDRNALRKRLEQDKIEFILVQFVDVHGAAKGKMVPASCLDDALDVGAGFAGAAMWGIGQGP